MPKELNNNNTTRAFFPGMITMLVGLLMASYFLFGIMPGFRHSNHQSMMHEVLVKPANAAELYPEFVCACCGKPLNPEEICCGSMSSRIAFIDQLVATGVSRDEAMVATVKEFGLNALAKETTKQEIKAMLEAQAGDQRPAIVLTQTTADLGEISQIDGIVSTAFVLENQGSRALVIDKLSTSCGCTSAAIVYQGVEGSTFTMPGHGQANPTNWSVSIAPGDTAELKVYYDPNAHGQQTQPSQDITRTISIFSNDPINFEQQVRIELVQTP